MNINNKNENKNCDFYLCLKCCLKYKAIPYKKKPIISVEDDDDI